MNNIVHFIQNNLINQVIFYVLLGATIILIFAPYILRVAGEYFYDKPFTYPGVKTKRKINKAAKILVILTLSYSTILWWGNVFAASPWLVLGIIISFASNISTSKENCTKIRLIGAAFVIIGFVVMVFATS